MRLTIPRQLVTGYVLIFVVVMFASVYAVKELFQFKEVVSIIEIDKRADELHAKLTDAFLSEIRNEMKFVILRDQALYEQSVASKDEFYRYLTELKQISSAAHEKELIEHIELLHRSYSTVFSEELAHIEANKRYPQDVYKKQKEQAVNGVTSALSELTRAYQLNTVEKLASLGKAGVHASQVAMVTTVVSLVIMVVLSVIITRSITKPIAALKERTKEIAAGNFEGTVQIASPPEMSELADAFNGMCARLQAVDRMKSDFYSLMSHELRTPLTSIREGTNLLLEGVGGQANEKQKRLLTIIAQESERLIKLVNSLLDLSKMEAGMATYHFSVGDLPRLIRKAITEVEPLVESKQIQMAASLQQGIPPLKIDGERILQVMRNLVANAIKVTPKGGSVSVAARYVDKGVAVSVSDTGPGIAEENLATIFDKYSQVGGHQTGDYRGTGLGLAIVRHIINAHGGKVWAESQVGRGSTFTFVLPV
jgi:two-component system sensor histidine kinase GlrK